MDPQDRAVAEGLEVSQELPAPPERVFRYLTEPKRMEGWLSARKVRFEPAPGGEVRIEFEENDAIAAGEIVAIDPEERIVFTWGLERGAGRESLPPGSSLVDLTLAGTEGGTLVILRHDLLQSEQTLRGREEEWRERLEQLRLQLAAEG